MARLALHFFHSYLISKSNDPLDAIAFACRDSITLVAEKHSLLAKKSKGQQVADSDEQSRLKHGSRTSSESESTESELSMLMLETGNVPKNE